MKFFKYIFWITLTIIVLIVIANITGLTTTGSDFQTLGEHDRFISNYLFFNTLTMYAVVVAFLNLFYGGVLFIVRGTRNTSSRRKDILIGTLLIVFPIVAWFYYMVVISMQSV